MAGEAAGSVSYDDIDVVNADYKVFQKQSYQCVSHGPLCCVTVSLVVSCLQWSDVTHSK